MTDKPDSCRSCWPCSAPEDCPATPSQPAPPEPGIASWREMAGILADLVEYLGTTGAKRTDVIRRAEDALRQCRHFAGRADSDLDAWCACATALAGTLRRLRPGQRISERDARNINAALRVFNVTCTLTSR